MTRAVSIPTADRLVPVVWPSGDQRGPWTLLEEGERAKGMYVPANMRGVTAIRFQVTHDHVSAAPNAYTLRWAEETDNSPEPFQIGGTGYSESYFPFIHYAWSGIRRFRPYRQDGTNPTADVELLFVVGLLWHN